MTHYVRARIGWVNIAYFRDLMHILHNGRFYKYSILSVVKIIDPSKPKFQSSASTVIAFYVLHEAEDGEMQDG